MNPRNPIAFLTAFLIATACGGGEAPAGGMEMDQTSPEIEVGGRFEVAAADPWNATVETAQLTCQRATPGSPFRAQWMAPDIGMGVLVTGFPQEGTNETRVDRFQVALEGERDARLSDATLTVEEVQEAGASSYYEVEASGTFVEGGTFTASGTCRA